MHVLITGGAGFIGAHLTRALLERGDRVAVLDNLSTGSIENIRAFADAVQKAKPAGAKGTYLRKVAISSTMGPGVKVEPSTVL